MPTQQQASETLFCEASSYFDRLLELIHESKDSILLEAYIFSGDAIAEKVANALCDAAARGVEIKVIVDGTGAESGFAKLATRMQEAGIEVGVHRPLPWDVHLLRFALDRYQGWRKIWYLLSYMNRRDHRKIVLIDEKVVMMGSINITAGHLHDQASGKKWRDTAIEIRNVPIANVIEAFMLTWLSARRREQRRQAKQHRASPFLLNYTRRLRRLHHKMLLWKIQESKQRVWITNAYFVPDRQLLSALTEASQCGVDIRVLLPQRSDIFFMSWVSSTFYKRLVEAGCQVFEYQPAMLHAKTILIDDWGIIGSTNLNQRSLHHDLEIDYVVQRKETTTSLEQHYNEDLMDAKRITPQDLALDKFWQRAAGRVLLRLFGYFV